MVENFSDLTHVYLMISTRQEYILAGKPYFEIWDTTFGVKINRYNAENGRFYDQPFRSVIEDTN